MTKKDRLAVISTKNPNTVLLETIDGLKKYYSEFDIVVVDSDSDNKQGFDMVPSDVIIEYAQNKNWELGAWVYAYNKYNDYQVYMFIQDSQTPISRVPDLDINDFNHGTLYSFHFHDKTITSGGFLDVNILYNVYKDTNLHFLYGIDPNTEILGTGGTSFITNNTNVRTILQLEDAYIEKNITKTKVDSWFSERTGGLLADMASNVRINLEPYFYKRYLRRDYSERGNMGTLDEHNPNVKNNPKVKNNKRVKMGMVYI
jgi:hypothetical protein